MPRLMPCISVMLMTRLVTPIGAPSKGSGSTEKSGDLFYLCTMPQHALEWPLRPSPWWRHEWLFSYKVVLLQLNSSAPSFVGFRRPEVYGPWCPVVAVRMICSRAVTGSNACARQAAGLRCTADEMIGRLRECLKRRPPRSEAACWWISHLSRPLQRGRSQA